MAIIIVGAREEVMRAAWRLATQLERGVRWKYRQIDQGDRWRIIMTPEFPKQYAYQNISPRARAALRNGRKMKDKLINVTED